MKKENERLTKELAESRKISSSPQQKQTINISTLSLSYDDPSWKKEGGKIEKIDQGGNCDSFSLSCSISTVFFSFSFFFFYFI
jgi:hypothetical protein